MQAQKAFSSAATRWIPLVLVATMLLFVYAPQGFGSSGGMYKDNPAYPADFAEAGCTSCHGDHKFAKGEAGIVTWNITDAEGDPFPSSNAYEHDATYTITIALDEQLAPDEDSHAGFNLAASAGTLAGVDGESQASEDGTEATHVDAGRTSWSVEWTAPAEGVAVFTLLVNDVDGNNAPDPNDQVYRYGFWLTDEHGAVPGAVEEEHAEFGISLQQYWIGLIGLAGMLFIMVFGFFYMKFASPHNTDQKDR